MCRCIKHIAFAPVSHLSRRKYHPSALFWNWVLVMSRQLAENEISHYQKFCTVSNVCMRITICRYAFSLIRKVYHEFYSAVVQNAAFQHGSCLMEGQAAFPSFNIWLIGEINVKFRFSCHIVHPAPDPRLHNCENCICQKQTHQYSLYVGMFVLMHMYPW